MSARKLADRFERFCREYVIDLNGARSAIAAGYAEKAARQQASALLTKPNVRRRIDQLQSQRASKLELTAEMVLEELRRLAFANMLDYMEIDEDGMPRGLNLSNMTRDQAAAIQEVTEDATGGSGDGERRLILRTKFKLADKGQNLERIGRHLGMFNDKLELKVSEGLAEKVAAFRKPPVTG